MLVKKFALSLAFSVLLVFCLSKPLLSMDTLRINDKTELINVSNDAYFLEDVSGNLTIDEIHLSEWQSKFEQSKGAVLDFPANNSFYWIRLCILPSSGDFVLFLNEAKLINVDLFYLSRDSSWKAILNGTSIPLNKREIRNNFPVFRLKLDKGRVSYIYLRLRPMGIPIPTYVSSYDYFQVVDARFKLAFGLVVGVILFISLSNLFLFFSTGDQLRLLYFFNSILFVVYAILFDGYSLYISDTTFLGLFQMIIILSFFSQLIILYYGYRFLGIGLEKGWVYSLSRSFMWLTFICFAVSFLISEQYFHFAVLVASIVGVLVLLLCLLMGFTCLKTANTTRKPVVVIYLVSYILFFLFFILEMGHIYLGWKYVFFVRYLDTSFVCEAIGLSIALNKQRAIEKESLEIERSRVQNENNILITEKNIVLEEKVNLRTLELQNKSKIAEELSQGLKVRSDELIGLNQVKDRILSILAHDLRSPLAQLHGLLTLSDDSYVTDDELKKMLAEVRSQMGSTVDLNK